MSDISWPNPNRAIGKRIAADISQLRIATKLMGAEEKIVKLKLVIQKPDNLATDGTIDTDTIRKDVTVGSDQLFRYKGERITLHIAKPEKTLEVIKKTGPKVHFTHCGAFTNMSNLGKKDRYFPGYKTDGLFQCHLIKEHSRGEREVLFIRLLPCRKCLRKLNYKNFSDISLKRDEYEMRKIVKEFNYEEFFKEVMSRPTNFIFQDK